MKIITILLIPFIFFNSCASKPKEQTKNPFNPLTIKESLRKGSTTQSEVLNTFGAPNITTQESSNTETWVYTKSSTTYGNGTVGMGAVAWLGVPIIGDIFGSKSTAEITSKSINLTLTFNSKKVLQEYKVVKTNI